MCALRPSLVDLTVLYIYLFLDACGRAGEAKHALELFQNMKDEGLSADRVAYNALFSALRVAGNADKVRGDEDLFRLLDTSDV